jgi:hypothetical protein
MIPAWFVVMPVFVDTSCGLRRCHRYSGKAHAKALFGTTVLVEISGDYPHQTPNPRSLLKICLVLEYWASLIPTNLHFFPNFSVFLSISNTLPLPSGLWVGFCGDWMKVGVSPNTLGDYPVNPYQNSSTKQGLKRWARDARDVLLAHLRHHRGEADNIQTVNTWWSLFVTAASQLGR